MKKTIEKALKAAEIREKCKRKEEVQDWDRYWASLCSSIKEVVEGSRRNGKQESQCK